MPSRQVPVGERTIAVNGYVRIKTGVGRAPYEHVFVAEQAIGRSLPVGARVHHVNDDKTDNRAANLCVLQNESEHGQLHRRRRILRAGGNPWTDRMCCMCGPRPTERFYRKAVGQYYTNCKDCNAAYCRQSRERSTGPQR